MAQLRWELPLELPVDEASELCRRALNYFRYKIESVDQHRIVARDDWTNMFGDANMASYGRTHVEVLLALGRDSETLVTFVGRVKGFGVPAKRHLQERLELLAGAIDSAARQRAADTGSAGQSKAAGTPDQSNAASDPIERLRQLSELRDAGIVTDEEFEAKKAEILGRI
jgi:hypothetical protein